MDLVIIPSIIIGLFITILELIFVHSDEGVGLHWFKHGLHAAPVCIIGTIIAMHVPLLFNFFPGLENIPSINIIVPVVIGILVTIKVKAAAAILHGHGNMGEKLPHALIIGFLVGLSPVYWPFIAPLFPSFLKKF